MMQMKPILILVLLTALAAQGQTPRQRAKEAEAANAAMAARLRLQQIDANAQAAANAKADKMAAIQAAIQAEKDRIANLKPRDYWRVVNNRRVAANGPGWYRFWGTVSRITKQGMFISGIFSKGDGNVTGLFVVSNFPFSIADGDVLRYEDSWWAFQDGVVIEGTNTFHLLNYEHIWTAPVLTQQERAQASADQVAELTAHAVAVTLAAAEKGDADCQMRMGERYRDGDGIAKDLPKAREWLAKAAAQGNKQAQQALDRLEK